MTDAAATFLQWFGVVLIVGAAFIVSAACGLAALGALCLVVGLIVEHEHERTEV